MDIELTLDAADAEAPGLLQRYGTAGSLIGLEAAVQHPSANPHHARRDSLPSHLA